MTESQAHTPGPWHAWYSNIQTRDGEQLAIVHGRQTAGAGDAVWAQQDAEDRRDTANARLMAAAPALLEAAQAALTLNPDTYAIGSSQRGSDTEWDLQRKQDALRAAIAAATGEEEAKDA